MAEVIKEHPTYYGIMPANVRYCENLKPNEKILYTEITALTQKDGKCFASNNYFAELYGVAKETVSGWIGNLEKQGFIKRELIYKQGTKQILNRYITINEYPINEKINTPIKKKLKDNTIKINTINNNILYIVDYLNEKAKTNYKSTTEKTRRLINARLNEKFTVEDFKTVIDKKVSEWKGTEFEKYLRPETLFGTKFEGYLNAKAINKPKTVANRKRPEKREYSKEQLDSLFTSINEINI